MFLEIITTIFKDSESQTIQKLDRTQKDGYKVIIIPKRPLYSNLQHTFFVKYTQM